MKALFTAVVMISLFSVANASVKAVSAEQVRKEVKIDKTCPFRTAKKLEKAKADYAYLLNESSAPAKSAPVKKSAPAKSADGVRRS